MSENRKEGYLQQQLDKAAELKKIYDNTLVMLQTEERFINLFKGHNKQSVDSFIKYYAQMKSSWYAYADSNYQSRMHKKNKWRNAALVLMKEIGLKKLFNLKCRWVAGEIDLEGIELSQDFNKWEETPYDCPYLDPISPEEFGCWLSFREYKKENPDDDDESPSAHSAFENYHWYRSIYMDNPEKLLPEWFHYYDKHFGTAPLLELSTIRIDIEQDYNDVWVEEIFIHTLTEEQKKTFSHQNRAMRKELKENPKKRKTVQQEI